MIIKPKSIKEISTLQLKINILQDCHGISLDIFSTKKKKKVVHHLCNFRIEFALPIAIHLSKRLKLSSFCLYRQKKTIMLYTCAQQFKKDSLGPHIFIILASLIAIKLSHGFWNSFTN